MKTMQDFADRQLSKRQMNEVKGGAGNLCAPGQQEFSCVLTLNGNSKGPIGRVCAGSLSQAHQLAYQTIAILNEPVVEGERWNVVCN